DEDIRKRAAHVLNKLTHPPSSLINGADDSSDQQQKHCNGKGSQESGTDFSDQNLIIFDDGDTQRSGLTDDSASSS
ncbi:3944_t:CDS:1, partial [Acaulospora morrowiae]